MRKRIMLTLGLFLIAFGSSGCGKQPSFADDLKTSMSKINVAEGSPLGNLLGVD